jgi:hypothetical protein
MRKTRKPVTLPSGGTCVIRAFSGMDYATMKKAPKAFPTPSEIENATSAKDLSSDQMNAGAELIEQLLLRCCSPITWPEEGRKRLVANKDLDQLGPDELTIEELSQQDANFIVATATEISHLKKEAGESVGNFLGESSVPEEPTPDLQAIRPEAK